jgi:predicted nucleic acid-binding protein
MIEFVLDTNVLSETARPRPAPRVLSWLEAQKRLLTSSVTWFELRRGIDMLPRSRRRQSLEDWLQRWASAGVEVLPFDREAASEAARIELQACRFGRGIEFRDLFVLATAAASGLGVATRNVADFDGLGVTVVDPFTDA